MPVLQAVVAAVGAASEITKGITTVGRALDGDRSVILIIENHTDHALERVGEGHDHGGWAVTPADHVRAREVLICGSRDRGFMTGTEGWVKFKVRDGRSDETFVTLKWSNPFVGRNSASASVFKLGPHMPLIGRLPLPVGTYRVSTVTGAGDRDVEIRYSIRRGRS